MNIFLKIFKEFRNSLLKEHLQKFFWIKIIILIFCRLQRDFTVSDSYCRLRSFWLLFPFSFCFKISSNLRLYFRSSCLEVFLGKGVLKICSKFTGERPCRSVISIRLLCNFIETALRHGCSPVNLLQIFRTAFAKNTPGWLLLLFHINVIE